MKSYWQSFRCIACMIETAMEQDAALENNSTLKKALREAKRMQRGIEEQRPAFAGSTCIYRETHAATPRLRMACKKAARCKLHNFRLAFDTSGKLPSESDSK